ncbi:MAG: aminomethyl-transferring glycine dehydrogenase, partial [Verrucomicrobia bacterium]|nr:aminomethyl-transferring glycine dehydrogenase [Verrucomicrobiota bacterium]
MNEAPALRIPTASTDASFAWTDVFESRHIGPCASELQSMLAACGCESMDELIRDTIPSDIRIQSPLCLPPAQGEHATLAELRNLSLLNKPARSFIGMGYHSCITPAVIQRNILENPGWYTQYTPYQAEIAQGRLEALLNFQTMVCDLTGMEIANASLLDEGTAVAEAMVMCQAISTDSSRPGVFLSDTLHPQTIAVVSARAEALGIPVHTRKNVTGAFEHPVFAAIVQYPATDGTLHNYEDFCRQARERGIKIVVAADLLSLAILRPPGEFGADAVAGSAQRFGVPLGFGGPHAGFLATRDAYKRNLPGRLVGVSKDSRGKPALRLTLQTREQHIRRERATSNICTAQVLLAVMASMYAAYHGPDGLRRIAQRVRSMTLALARGLSRLGCDVTNETFFDTLRIRPAVPTAQILQRAAEAGINLRVIDAGSLGISLDEATSAKDIETLLQIVAGTRQLPFKVEDLLAGEGFGLNPALLRTTPFLTHPVFNSYHSETEMLRYIRRLESRDLSLTHSMIPLGSCTMKLNAAAEMYPVTWGEIGGIHPFAPASQTEGYQELFRSLEQWLSNITGFAATSLQPNAGSQGEYAGLLVIRRYHERRGDGHRSICLIPTSAHGTNPASAVMAGMQVAAVACDALGNIDLADLESKARQHSKNLAALMVTYPSTHGVFEDTIREICRIIHSHGGQVYMDGANMNAQVGLCRPGDMGADVCHLNL